MKTQPIKVLQLIVVSVILLFNSDMYAQAFKKGAFLISISEGGVNAHYNTNNKSIVANDINPETPTSSRDYLSGIRDPLIIEYGITNRIGIGFAAGGDIWKIDPKKYGINAPGEKINILTKEFTFDLSYHILVTRNVDWTIYGSIGGFSVLFNENFNGKEQNYYADGHILRTGSLIRYYVFKRWAVLGMVSLYDSKAAPKEERAKIEENNLPHDYATRIKGWAFEFGISFRIGKYAWDKPDLSFEEE